MTRFAEWDYIKFEFFFVAFVMMIVCGWFAAFGTLQREGTWHSASSDFGMKRIPSTMFLWLTFAIIFKMLSEMFAILILPLTRILGVLLFSFALLIAFSFSSPVFGAKSFSATSFCSCMAGFALRTIAKAHHIARFTFSLGIMLPFMLTAHTNNYSRHTVVIIL